MVKQQRPNTQHMHDLEKSKKMTELGFLKYCVESVARGVSYSGNRVVGKSAAYRFFDDRLGCKDQAFICDTINGMRSIQDFLINRDLGSLYLTDCTAINVSGTVMVGHGLSVDQDPAIITETAWFAVIPQDILF